MSRRCTVCDHPKRREIDKALIAGNSLSHTAVVFDLTVSALFRHRKEHLAPLVAKAQAEEAANEVARVKEHRQSVEADETAHALDMSQQLKVVNAACLEVLRKARTDAKQTTLLQAVDRIHRQITLQAQLLGGSAEDTSEADSIQTQWPRIRQVVIDALRPFPEARIAVAEALSHLSDDELSHAEP